jgi:hypothetical protein
MLRRYIGLYILYGIFIRIKTSGFLWKVSSSSSSSPALRIRPSGQFLYRINFWKYESYHMWQVPWTGDRPISRLLPTQDNIVRINADIHPRLEWHSDPRFLWSSGPGHHVTRLAPCDHWFAEKCSKVLKCAATVRQHVSLSGPIHCPLLTHFKIPVLGSHLLECDTV